MNRIDIFMSYQWEIKDKVELFHERLSSTGMNVWRDNKLRQKPEGLYEQLAENINNSKIILCFLTNAYIKSKNCYKELSYATRIGKHIIYLMIEKMNTNQLGRVGFIMEDTLYTQCYNKPDSWWIDYFDDIKTSLEDGLKVGLFV